MRLPTKRTTVGELRRIIGLGQKEFAELIGKAMSTVQSLELKRLTLSESLAQRIYLETGVSLEWLLAGDPDKPCIDRAGKRYGRETYEEAQAWKNRPPDSDSDVCNAKLYMITAIGIVAELLIDGFKNKRLDLNGWRVKQALHELGGSEHKGSANIREAVIGVVAPWDARKPGIDSSACLRYEPILTVFDQVIAHLCKQNQAKPPSSKPSSRRASRPKAR